MTRQHAYVGVVRAETLEWVGHCKCGYKTRSTHRDRALGAVVEHVRSENRRTESVAS